MTAIAPPVIIEFGEIDVETDGVPDTRYYGWIEPDPTTPDPLPLVLALHGGGGNMTTIANQLGLLEQGPRPHLTVIPQGFGSPPAVPHPDPGYPANAPTEGTWNSGQDWIGYQHGRDDVAFFDALLLETTRRAATAGWRIDQHRTYAIGFSNGGMMVYRLAAERSAELAAIAVIGCSIGGVPDPADPAIPFDVNHPGVHGADPVPVLHAHGGLDRTVPFGDGPTQPSPSTRSDLPAQDAIDIWVAHNGCDRHPTIEALPEGLRRTWSNGIDGSEVQLLTLPRYAHEVPDGFLAQAEDFLFAHSR